jgi:PHAX RNA-binding domain
MEPLTVETLAEALQEPNRRLLALVLHHVGQERAAATLAEALAREANGGMLTKDGTRRRSPGGVFFQLIREQLAGRERRQVFHAAPSPRPARKPARRPQVPALPWADVEPVLQALATTTSGEARTMKLTLIGRPGKVETKGQTVVFRMQGTPPASLPRGLPPVPAQPPLTWNVIVAQRQWNRVKDSLAANTDDQLIIEGYPALQGKELVVLAQSCTSIALQRAQKAAQREETTP